MKTQIRKTVAPTVLSLMGSAGVIFTAILAVKATPKAVELIRANSRKEHDGDPYASTPKEAVQAAWHCYIPAIVAAGSTIFCILGANYLNKKTQASLVSAYVLLEQSFKEYQKRVKDVCWDDAANKEKEYVPIEPDAAATDKCLFYDPIGERYFERTMVEVRDAEYHANRNLVLRGYVPLNEFYEFLDIPALEIGNDIGWSVDVGFDFYGYSWIDFDHVLTTMDDGLECYIINMPFAPTADYLSY